MFEVIYHSSTGNTRKVAETMAKSLGVAAQDIGAAGVVNPDAFIFLGLESNRAVLPDMVRAFIHQNRFRGRKIALFTTSVFGFEPERRELEKQLEAEGAIIVRRFKCYGRLADINKEHPTWLELKKAAWFARSAALTLYEKRTTAIYDYQPAAVPVKV